MNNSTLVELERLIEEAREDVLADLESMKEDVLDLSAKMTEAIGDGDYKEAASCARAATLIGTFSLGGAFDEAYDLLRSIEDGADRMAEEALEHQRWHDYEG